ncbi:DNA damage-binding protein CMR1 [Ceratocystis fimbriata CBS 114723]|uniref:DNA damage-binding protein CMR1 n=1 Tax=Ceratocystis fimbriata CBS 114723 TaxID=1035309 RepID=A0A2C5X284_9PEZI|nr:DNA damage-binding protein CMR1 [Ceratocystis fimbriata CBS 114723]
MAPKDPPMSAFERRRLENMAANTAILKDISITAKKVAPAKPKAGPAPATRSKSTRKRPRSETTSSPAPTSGSASAPALAPARVTRQSSRLAGINADDIPGQAVLAAQLDASADASRAKRLRVSGDLKLDSLVVDGKKWSNSSAVGLRDLVRGARPGVRTFTAEDVAETTDEGLKKLREELGRMELYETWAPGDIKITPQRVYALGFHPTEDKPLVFAGDKEGALGVFDASQEPIKAEVDEDDEDAEETYESPSILAFKTHTRTISAFAFSPFDSNSVFSASYDSSIRKVDLSQGLSVEVYSPAQTDIDMPISALEIMPSDPTVLLFSTLSGSVCRADTRKPGIVDEWTLSDQKIGGFSVHPLQPHLLATASLDRTMKIWDLRKMAAVEEEDDSSHSGEIPALLGSHSSRLSVSHAAWSAGGHIATSSYDDTIKIYDFSQSCGAWKPGAALSTEALEPTHIIRHNNQTGRWVTILKPQWQRTPRDGIQKMVVGNMNRFVDVFAADGSQLAQLDGEGISAVPAVAQFHPTLNWVAGGTASGKLCLWQSGGGEKEEREEERETETKTEDE